MRQKTTDILIKLIIAFTFLMLFPQWFFSLMAFGFNQETDEDYKIAIIFGAAVWNNQEPTWVLQNRLDKGLELYNEGKVKKLLVTGDNRFEFHNEPTVMKNYLIKNGVPEEDIIEDFAGRRTADSCWRAKNVFQIDKAYIVTQDFHLPRTYFLCEQMGIEVKLASAEDSTKSTKYYGIAREIPASWLTVFDVFKDYEAEIKGDGSEQDLSDDSLDKTE